MRLLFLYLVVSTSVFFTPLLLPACHDVNRFIASFLAPLLCLYFIVTNRLKCKTLLVLQLRWPSGKSVCFWSCRLGFSCKSGQINDFKVDIHSFPA